MIPDIAFMIVVYGAARLLVAALDPYRNGTGTAATLATTAIWVITAAALVGLALLGVDVAGSSSSSLSNVTG